MFTKQAQDELISGYRRKLAFGAGMLGEIQGLDQKIDRVEFAAALYVDIAGFSRRIDGWSATQVREYLDGYYELCLPLIRDGGGRVDRVAGDGVIAVFCPFLATGLVDHAAAEHAAHATARNIVKAMAGTHYAVKAALSSGQLLFCLTGLEAVHEEYTVIGQPMTELYRTEEAALVNQVVHRADARLGLVVMQSVNEEEAQRRRGLVPPLTRPYWTVGPDAQGTNLRGVNKGLPVTLLRETFIS